jgi:Bacteriophage head to tail connecting protein
MDSRVDDIIRRQEKMSTDRAIFDSHWREIAERILPRADHFRVNRNPGDKHTEKIFDATANLALERFAAAMESMLTPRTQRWHKLKTGVDELDQNQEVQTYLDEVVKILFSVRYSPKANFASQANECYMSLGAFGTGGMFIDDLVGRGIRYRSIPLSEMWIAENHQGVIDTVHRRFSMTVRQAAQQWGRDKLSEKMKNALEKQPEQMFDFIHAVCPREDVDTNKKNYKGMPIASCYISIDGRNMMSEGGYQSMPYAVGRYVTGPKEVYGRSPAMTVLPDIKMLNEMSKTVIRAAHKLVDPPLLLQEDGALAAFDLRPGALNYGGVNEQGQQLVHALQTGARVDIGLDMMEQRRKTINDAFLVTLFQILVDAPQMTATEAMLRAQEKGALLAPTMGRQQSEFLGPLIEREIDILARAGVLPPMPDIMREAGGMVDIEYVSPLNRAQRSEEGVAIMRTLEAVAPLAQVDPKVMMIFDPEAMARELADINGVPAKVMRSPDQVKAIEDQQAEAAQAQQLLAAAPVASGVVKDLAQAQSMAGSASQQAPQIFPA